MSVTLISWATRKQARVLKWLKIPDLRNKCSGCLSWTYLTAALNTRREEVMPKRFKWGSSNLELLQAHPRHLRSVWKRWWCWLPQSGCVLWVTWSMRGNIEETRASPADLEGQCAYSITRCGVSVRHGQWGLDLLGVGRFFWKVSDKLSLCPPPSPFPNPARSCFADRSARREETGSARRDHITLYTSSSAVFLSRPRSTIWSLFFKKKPKSHWSRLLMLMPPACTFCNTPFFIGFTD